MSGEQFPAQRQEYPGSTGEMQPEPHDEMRGYRGAGRLEGKRAGDRRRLGHRPGDRDRVRQGGRQTLPG